MLENIEYFIMLRCFFLTIILIVVSLVLLFARIFKKNTKWLGRIVILLLVVVFNCVFCDVIKTNFITFNRNLSEKTITLLVDAVNKNEQKFYNNIEKNSDKAIVMPTLDFHNDYFIEGYKGELYVYDDRLIPVELLYESDNVKIYQSRVKYCGTFPIFPIEPSYYLCSVYVVKNKQITEISISGETLLFFNVDKIIESAGD